jgi:hypothetical protein
VGGTYAFGAYPFGSIRPGERSGVARAAATPASRELPTPVTTDHRMSAGEWVLTEERPHDLRSVGRRRRLVGLPAGPGRDLTGPTVGPADVSGVRGLPG